MLQGLQLQSYRFRGLLGGSWVLISGVLGRITIIITPISGLITLLITTHEPPSRDQEPLHTSYLNPKS